MKSIFNLDNKFFVFMGKVADLMILNILWLVCSIPVVTIGASTSALYYSVLKMVRKEDSYPTRMFFHSFKQNLKQGTVLTLLFLFIAVFLSVDIQIVRSMEGQAGKVFLIIFIVLAAVLAMIITYTFPMLAQFENTNKNILRNSLLMCISHLPSSIIMTVLNLIPIFMIAFFPYEFFMVFPLWIVIAFSLIAFINSLFFKKIFHRYMPKEDEEAQETEETENSELSLEEAYAAERIITPIPVTEEADETPTVSDTQDH